MVKNKTKQINQQQQKETPKIKKRERENYSVLECSLSWKIFPYKKYFGMECLYIKNE